MDDKYAHSRLDHRIIIHFDYDCFYASVFEAENPTLKSLPLAVQQKQIIVTCNYEARNRGLYKLQLITEARKICPDVIIVLGEDLTRFRDASKKLCGFLREHVWSDKVERLGFDEVFMDCTDMIDYNLDLLNYQNLSQSFFCTDRQDPTIGFSFDASRISGPGFPSEDTGRYDLQHDDMLKLKLLLGSHLARHLRYSLEEELGYTATVGIATNKLLAKLVGNVNKPRNQTTLMPPYRPNATSEGHAISFMDGHDVGKVPGIGFKLSHKIRAHVLGRPAVFDTGLVYGGTREKVSVRDVRTFQGMSPKLLEEILSGPGSYKGIGGIVYNLLHGIDDAEVAKAKKVPSQISIEDSYIRLDTIEEVRKELLMLSQSLIKRMHADLTEEDDMPTSHDSKVPSLPLRRWLAHPRTLRLSTRPRPPLNADGTRPRSFNRISRSCPTPNFIFGLKDPVEDLSERLVHDTLIGVFKKLHPERSGWNLSLVNIAVTNMAESAADSKDSKGRDIGKMFQRQDEVLRDWKVIHPLARDSLYEGEMSMVEAVQERSDYVETSNGDEDRSYDLRAELAEHVTSPSADASEAVWDDDEDDTADLAQCSICSASLPRFAVEAHSRYHDTRD